jgi:hypothetical protein
VIDKTELNAAVAKMQMFRRRRTDAEAFNDQPKPATP